MNQSDDDDGVRYRVVVNHEEQYSIWPDFKPNPAGWSDAGVAGTRLECLDHVAQVWTDMRPLSLRLRMQAAAAAIETKSQPE
jgi:MbtH protein